MLLGGMREGQDIGVDSGAEPRLNIVMWFNLRQSQCSCWCLFQSPVSAQLYPSFFIFGWYVSCAVLSSKINLVLFKSCFCCLLVRLYYLLVPLTFLFCWLFFLRLQWPRRCQDFFGADCLPCRQDSWRSWQPLNYCCKLKCGDKKFSGMLAAANVLFNSY